MISNRFNKIFNNAFTLDEEKEKFINRINQTIFPFLEKKVEYPDLFNFTCWELGLNSIDLVKAFNQGNYTYDKRIPSLRKLTRDEFEKSLEVICIIRSFYHKDEFKSDIEEMIDLFVEESLKSASLSLGIRWKDGMFYPSGAPYLDNHLVDDVLGLLDKKELIPVKSAFEKGIKAFSTNTTGNLQNAGRDMQVACDELIKYIFKDNNLGFKHLFSDSRIKQIGLNRYQSRIYGILNDYFDKEIKHKAEIALDNNDVENIIYLTGQFIRLCLSKST